MQVIKKGRHFFLLIGCIILFFVIKKVGLSTIIHILITFSPFFLAIGLLVWISNLIIGAFRFKFILSSHVKFLDILEIYIYGSLFNYAAAIQGLGAGARIGLLKIKKVDFSKSTASIGTEIIYDIFLSIIFSILGIIFLRNLLINIILQTVTLKFLIIPIIVLCLFLFIFWIFRKHSFIENFLLNLLRSFSQKNLIINCCFSFGVQFTGTLFTFLLYKAAGLHINFFLLFFAKRIGYLFGLVSCIPGGLGVRDAVTGYVCSLTGIPVDVTISISLITRFLSLVVNILLLGGMAFLKRILKL